MHTKIALTLCVALLLAAATWMGRVTTAVGQDQPKANAHQNEEALKQAKIDYAKALLKVAEADLAKSREADSKVPGTVPFSIIRGLQNDVAIGNARLQAMLGAVRQGENPYVLSAKDSLAFAEEAVRQANTANARAPGAVSRGEVERRQADVDLAKAKLEVAKLMDNADPLEIARWELMQLQEDVHDLRYRVRLLQYRN